MGISLELAPRFQQLRLAGNESGMGRGEVVRVLLNLLEIHEQVVADGILATCHQCLGHPGGLLLGGKPQRGSHGGGTGTVLLDGLAGGEVFGQGAVLAHRLPPFVGAQLVDGAADEAVFPCGKTAT